MQNTDRLDSYLALLDVRKKAYRGKDHSPGKPAINRLLRPADNPGHRVEILSVGYSTGRSKRGNGPIE